MEVRGRARWATEDRERKGCLLSESFIVELNFTAREKQHPTAVLLTIIYQLLGSGSSMIL